MSDRFDLESFCQLVQEHQPDRAHLVPPVSAFEMIATFVVKVNGDLVSLYCLLKTLKDYPRFG
jgi:hypothetical protein